MDMPTWAIILFIGSIIMGVIGAVLSIVCAVMYVRTLTKTFHAAILHGTINYFWGLLFAHVVTILGSCLILREAMGMNQDMYKNIALSACLAVFVIVIIFWQLAWMERDSWVFRNNCSARIWDQKWNPFRRGFLTLHRVENDL